MKNKKTKIVATISDKKCDKVFLQTLVDEGVNVIRLNTAHQNEEQALKVINSIREISDSVAILIDTKGPEIRTVKSDIPIVVEEGDVLKISGDSSSACDLCVSYPQIVRDVPIDSSILIDDGDIELKVIEKDNNFLHCRVENKGAIKGMKSVNIPNVKIKLPSLTEKDKAFVHFAIKNNLDFIAHSFVRSEHDVSEINEIIKKYKSNIKIIAKIENQQGIDNIDEILDHVYGVMIARGDLALEIPAEKVPLIQQELVAKCIINKRPVIIATQMLHSMITNPRPTRAEITDVAHAIFSHADAIMLSGETAYGDYPKESVQTMTKVALEIEKDLIPKSPEMNLVKIDNEITAMLAKAAVSSSKQLPIKAVLIDTLTGRTARYISSFRGRYPVYAICYNETIKRQMALSYGVESVFMPAPENRGNFMSKALDIFMSKKFINEDDLIIVLGGSFGPSKGASFMEICKVSDLRHKN